MAQMTAVKQRNIGDRITVSEILRAQRNVIIVWVLLVLLLLVVSATAPLLNKPPFATGENARNILVQATSLGIISVGQTFVILTAGIDISVGAVASLVVVLMSRLADKNPEAVPWAVAVGMLVGLAIGLINGIGITRFKVSPFMMTLGTMSISLGIALQLRPQPGGLIPGEFAWLAAGEWFGIPIALYFFLAVTGIGYWVLTSTRFGRHIYAVGGNEETTRLTGLATDRIKLGVYALCGFTAALAGIFLSSRIRSGDAHIGDFLGLDSIPAVVLGGTSLFGGRGSVLGTIAGVFIIVSLSKTMNFLDVSTYWQNVAKGGLLIVAASIYSFRRVRK